MNDSVFEVGNIVVCPIIVTEQTGKRFLENSIDSVALIAEFLIKHRNIVFEFSNHSSPIVMPGNFMINMTKFRVDFVSKTLFNEFEIHEDQLIIKAYGGAQPIVPILFINQMPKEDRVYFHRLNNRYELKVISIDD